MCGGTSGSTPPAPQLHRATSSNHEVGRITTHQKAPQFPEILEGFRQGIRGGGQPRAETSAAASVPPCPSQSNTPGEAVSTTVATPSVTYASPSDLTAPKGWPPPGPPFPAASIQDTVFICAEARGRLATWKEATGRGAMRIAGSNAEKLLGVTEQEPCPVFTGQEGRGGCEDT